MGFWQNVGEKSIAKAVGGVIDGGFGALQNWQNYKYGELAANAADRRHRDQFKDMYSMEAQMEQAKKAGLSPSMFFGGTPSQGGASTPQGNGASGPTFNSSPLDAMTSAELEALKEQTRGMKIENDNKQAEIDADIALKLSQAGLNEASQAYKNVQTEREQLALIVDTATTQDQINERQNIANKMFWESWLVQYNCRSAAAKATVDEATVQTRINAETAKYQELLTNIRVGESVVALNEATIQKMALDLGLAWYNADTQRMSFEAQKKWFTEQINVELHKLYQQQQITEEQFKVMKQGQWLDFATDVFGTIANGSVGTLHAVTGMFKFTL